MCEEVQTFLNVIENTGVIKPVLWVLLCYVQQLAIKSIL